ncbi:Scr1 family TA system antitoxin-like transcriptional regulator [Streptomyces sp. NPDC050585]|uniref:Scr1 family TA system antitoxin-like transcriptional regulator n=1 Tax=Streptomyces sp. NPDC050585 TaxID=3365632 RepID=UPI0037B1309B
MRSSPKLGSSLAEHLIGLHLAALPAGTLLKRDMFEELGGLLRGADDEDAVVETSVEDDGRHHLRDTGFHRRERLWGCMSGADAVRVYTGSVIPIPFQAVAHQQAMSETTAAARCPLGWLDPEPAAVTLIVDEFVLSRPSGGPEVMGEQLEYLRLLAEQGAVVFRVLPSDAPVGVLGGALYEIERPEQTYYAEECPTAIFYRAGPHTPALRAYMQRYERNALPPAQSLELLGEAISRMARKQN